MEPIYSILTFPQHFSEGRLHFNIVVLPRNINLRNPLPSGAPAFVDATFQFDTQIINQLDGLPLFSTVTHTETPQIAILPVNKKAVIDEVIAQMEANDGLQISENQALNKDSGARAQAQKYATKNVAIKKYLPQTYRNSFNFTSSRTRFAVTDDSYECIIKNKDRHLTDELTDRRYISWGKLVGFILRNSVLAEKAGLIYKASIPVSGDVFKKGGWLFTRFGSGSEFGTTHCAIYAARLPALKNDRTLFAPVLFPVTEIAANNATYDAVMQEAILYNDGFAKIVHANQPVNQDLLQESDTTNPPLKDLGLQLGWDDEQLTIWGNRQLRQKDELTDLPIDAPLGVFGYKVDIRKLGDSTWFSQNRVMASQDIKMQNGEVLFAQNRPFELPTEVHPSSHGNTMEEGFWLPMYFAAWNGKCMVIPDREAQEIHLLEKPRVAVSGLASTNAVNLQPKKNFHPFHQDPTQTVALRYGHDYEVRIRLMDISGGSPKLESEPLNGGQKSVAQAHFRRNIKAGAVKISNINEFFRMQTSSLVRDTSVLENILDEDNILRIKRPDLSYPSVAYTGKYEDAGELLKNKINGISVPADPADRSQQTIGLPDPDVNSFKVLVEVKSLEMDNVLSENGREAYILWQEKTFTLPKDLAAENYDLAASIKIVYQDFHQLDLLNNYTGDEDADELLLPTSRHLRLTFIPIVDFADDDYAAKFVASGTPLSLNAYKAAEEEPELLSPIKGGLRAFYLQPESKPEVSEHNKLKLASTKTMVNVTAPELKRLAEALDLSSHNLTLQGEPGQRVQFGVSNEIRHSLAPESGSVTLSSVNELFNRWIIAVDFSVLRDWSWQGFEPDSITVMRKVHAADTELMEIGSVQLKDTANMQMLQDADRTTTRVMFLDSIDPKKYQKNFPRELFAEYSLKLNFKNEETVTDEFETLNIQLPVTVIPHQVPKLVSAGVALTPYQYDRENYRYSDERQKYLWLEFDKAPENPRTTYYARILAYSPDPYLCRVDRELISNISEDQRFNINDEKIREIIPRMTNDFAGIGVMQELIPEEEENATRYLLPLPPGLHSASDELFGFFTYEIRVGHRKEVWATAQGRYGRPLKVNGVQHPAPELACHAVRSEIKTPIGKNKYVELSAPHASAVLNGENITAFPPNTSLWYSLYTQVMQADGESFRNILIDSGPMPYHPKKSKINDGGYIKENGNRMGTAKLSVREIGDKLEALGLPRSNSISAIAVEIFPMDNKWQLDKGAKRGSEASYIEEYLATRSTLNPLTDLLGQHRIYRSSKLTGITEVCCEDC
ncbi:hypothetical protein [Kaistella rhinocerotis]|uniref:hypothetical protein n=1 Tax=Kaistella rhinocerotis TaxID=3026437 RepID=UPI0025578DF4|nr:hypothetical protein [Kaistella sp. Ran72]